jgi:hypothetical protein
MDYAVAGQVDKVHSRVVYKVTTAAAVVVLDRLLLMEQRQQRTQDQAVAGQ